MLNSPYIDDIYTTMKLTVQDTYITIDPIGNQEAGTPFTIAGTTNLAPNNQLLIEITPTSFTLGDKNQQTSASGISGTVTIITGNPNAWPYPVSGHSLPIDSYTSAYQESPYPPVPPPPSVSSHPPRSNRTSADPARPSTHPRRSSRRCIYHAPETLIIF